MAALEIDQIFETRKKLDEIRTSVMERVLALEGGDGAKFDFDIPFPGINRSIAEVDARVLGLLDLIAGFEGIEDTLFVPRPYLLNLAAHLNDLINHYENMKANLDDFDNRGGPGLLDPTGFTVQSSDGGKTINVAREFQRIYDLTDVSLQNYYLLTTILKGKGYHDFSIAFGEISRQLQAQRKLRTEAQHLVGKTNSELATLLDQFQQKHEAIEELRKQASELQAETDRLKTEADKDRKTISEYTSESTDKVTTIRSTAEQADQLKGAVQEYQSQFDQFQSQLDLREKTLKEGHVEQNRLIEKLREIETEINRLNSQAEDMLTGATVAGLASSFGTARDALSDELTSARRVFYLAICVLFIAVFPLVVYVLPGLTSIFPALSSIGPASQETSTPEFLGQVLIRALLLLPAAWLAKFAAARHAVVFRLKEHYAYKYSVASSVEGFKKQAEPFKDEIAAAAFFELTFNPANTMETKAHEERHPNPVMDRLMKRLGVTYDGESS